uniref:Uncharacterized protein n=1 Tax=Sphaerodactylus townsendi TaxID=933632 RepID=A0ACB8FZB8_9SAUR
MSKCACSHKHVLKDLAEASGRISYSGLTAEAKRTFSYVQGCLQSFGLKEKESVSRFPRRPSSFLLTEVLHKTVAFLTLLHTSVSLSLPHSSNFFTLEVEAVFLLSSPRVFSLSRFNTIVHFAPSSRFRKHCLENQHL